MKKKKILILATIVCMLFIAVFIISLENNGVTKDKEETSALVSVQQALDSYETSIKKANYDNLIFHKFNATIEGVESIYNIRILPNAKDRDATFLEGFALMEKAVDDFFQEEFDKSYLEVKFYMPEGVDDEAVPYDEITTTCDNEKYDVVSMAVLFGNNISTGGRMIQIARGGGIAWFSRGGFGTIDPYEKEYKDMYKYISGIRQSDDTLLNLKDGTIKLSEMEEKALSYVRESFPCEVNKKLSFAIGDVKVIDLGDYDGICFKIRRVYKGIPFEYGYSSATGIYVDKCGHDRGELSCVESYRPDTMAGFGNLEAEIVETETITEMIPLDKALDLLSDKIGDNSIYDVYGVELVYRDCYTDEEIEKIEEEEKEDISEILKPMWKVITINQNDDKYTLFYVDVVTGEVTERFEYYYE